MSYVKDRSIKYKILEESKKVYPCPDLDEILPPDIDAIEDSMTEEDFDKFVTKKFNAFYAKYVNSSVKDLFVNLPLEFFTKQNVDRVRRYANIAFAIKVENSDLFNSKKFYEEIHIRFLKMLKKKADELKNKNFAENFFKS
ncbi:MAG: hypothetical protein IKM43_00720 [Clostridia bacterium]|nr:hypothetical protein [Clostridia bacterium]